jgi:predicted  nucleic acid-binding Zn-ribbon protein
MFSKTRIRKIITELENLKAENEMLAKANIALEKKLAGNTAEITLIKSDLSELKEISISEPIKK